MERDFLEIVTCYYFPTAHVKVLPFFHLCRNDQSHWPQGLPGAITAQGHQLITACGRKMPRAHSAGPRGPSAEGGHGALRERDGGRQGEQEDRRPR